MEIERGRDSDQCLDSWEQANPFESKKQRREREVRRLIEKLQPDTIMVDPHKIGNINPAAAQDVVRCNGDTMRAEIVIHDLLGGTWIFRIWNEYLLPKVFWDPKYGKCQVILSQLVLPNKSRRLPNIFGLFTMKEYVMHIFFASAGSIHHVMWSFLAKIWQKKAKIYHITWRPWALKTSTFGIMWCDNFWPNLRLEGAEGFHIRWRMLTAQ